MQHAWASSWCHGAGAEARDGATSRCAHVAGREGAWIGAMDHVRYRLDVAVARHRWQRGLEVEGTDVASVVYDDIGVERLIAAETGSGLGVAAAEDEARSSGSRWTPTRWCRFVDVTGLLLGAEEEGEGRRRRLRNGGEGAAVAQLFMLTG